MKKRMYKVEVFGIGGRSVNDPTLRWDIESTSGSEAIKHVKEQLVLANNFSTYEIAQYSMSATYMQDA